MVPHLALPHRGAPRRPTWQFASPGFRALLGLLWAGLSPALLEAASPDLQALSVLLQEHCVECHGSKDPDGGLVLESLADLRKGGESGPTVVPGKAADSRLIQALEGTWGKTGKNQFMPPGKREHLKPAEVAQFRAWIEAGAPLPATTDIAPAARLAVPAIPPRRPPPRSVRDLAYDVRSGWLAIARPDGIELALPGTTNVLRTLGGIPGPFQAVAFSADGRHVFGAAGVPGQPGELHQWRRDTGALVRTFRGPKDSIQSVAVRADGSLVAAGSYDHGVTLWRVADGTVQARGGVHQGAVMGLAFRPDGALLATASQDRTAKLVDPVTGLRRETFGQALKELNAVAFSPDGTRLLTGGHDNRIRAYRVGPDGKEGENPLEATVFAHEGAILRLAFSPDGKSVASAADDLTVKLYAAGTLQPRATVERQPDWPTALAFAGDDRLVVGRMDGSVAVYQARDGQAWTPPPPPKPVLQQAEPTGVRRGTTTRVRLIGQHLAMAEVVRVFTDHLVAAQRPEGSGDTWSIDLDVPPDAARGPMELSVQTPAGESGRVKVWVDDLPQSTAEELTLPVAAWGVLARRGETAEFRFTAQAGETLVFDLHGQRLGNPGDYTLTLLDAERRPLAHNDSHAGQSDPLILHTFTASGTYRVRVGEATYAGSPAHRFRLSIGALPFVTGLFPGTLPADATNTVVASGPNLPGAGRVTVVTGDGPTQGVPLPDGWRTRVEWKVDVTRHPTSDEAEPNAVPAQANPVTVPGVVRGRLDPAGDVDLHRFAAEAGRTYVIETTAARRGSTADTRIEVLWPDGRPVERLRLQAVRDSAVTFRPEDANDSGIRFENWEEMELNDYLYCGGEVMKLFRAPQGPDSDSVMYASNGRRRAWFDTTATSHYLDEPVYVVQPLAPDAKPVANGLPVFTLNHRNDDAALRDAGRDSRLSFTAPATGDYLVRVDDPRGAGAPTATYSLTIRPAEPDFMVRLNSAPGAVARGSGQAFTLDAERRDGFEDAIDVAFLHLPAGWTVGGPARIEAGHPSATLTLQAAMDANQPGDADWDAVRVVASARPGGRAMMQAVNALGRPRLGTNAPKVRVSLEPVGADGDGSLTIHPGGTARARLRIERNGHDGVVTFGVDNLPHGVIVENLGLNGITFLADENEREISFSAVRWVQDMDRPFHAVENQAGRQTSRPVLLKVRRPPVGAGPASP